MPTMPTSLSRALLRFNMKSGIQSKMIPSASQGNLSWLALFIFTPFISLFVIGCSDSYSISVQNHSKENWVIRSIRLEEKTMRDIEKTLPPVETNKLSHTEVFAKFSSRNPKTLEIVATNQLTGRNQKASCMINDKEQAGCLVKVIWSGSSKINCVCDSYADF